MVHCKLLIFFTSNFFNQKIYCLLSVRASTGDDVHGGWCVGCWVGVGGGWWRGWCVTWKSHVTRYTSSQLTHTEHFLSFCSCCRTTYISLSCLAVSCCFTADILILLLVSYGLRKKQDTILIPDPNYIKSTCYFS